MNRCWRFHLQQWWDRYDRDTFDSSVQVIARTHVTSPPPSQKSGLDTVSPLVCVRRLACSVAVDWTTQSFITAPRNQGRFCAKHKSTTLQFSAVGKQRVVRDLPVTYFAQSAERRADNASVGAVTLVRCDSSWIGSGKGHSPRREHSRARITSKLVRNNDKQQGLRIKLRI